jgi:hypothetical protein
MSPYAMLGSAIGTSEAASLTARLSAWHDAMVAHERRLGAGSTSLTCDDECPHADARALWSEAVAAFGSRAHELTFLRTRATGTRRPAAGRTDRVGPDVERGRSRGREFPARRSNEAASAVAEW